QSTDFDAGQDLTLLAKYVNKREINNIKFAYGGTADPFYYLNLTCIACPSCPLWALPKCPENCTPMSGTIAVFTALIVYAPNLENVNCFDWIKSYEPIDKIGYTIFIYNLTKV
ncbi:MAG: hypothetical protein AABY14_04065, partial [Nanoarchaeota archaeon]